jgi:hypothetical protein
MDQGSIRGKHVRAKENPEIFLLVGKKYGMYHLLGGSGHHVVGNVRASEVRINYSYFPYIASRLPDTVAADPARTLTLNGGDGETDCAFARLSL